MQKIIGELPLFDSGSRLHWSYLLSTLAIILIYGAWSTFRGDSSYLKRLVRGFLSSSSRLDLKIFAINLLLRAFVLPIAALSGVSVGYFILTSCIQIFGKFEPIILPQWLITALFSISFVMLEDFLRFLVHLAFHRYKWLWRFHAVHHSANVLTPLTLLRVHPLEIATGSLRNAFSLGLCSGLFFYFFGSQISMWEILGVEVIGFVFNITLANFRHSHFYWGYGILEHIFISPAQHQIHHSLSRDFHHSNYGVIFSFWDKLFGSWIPSHKRSAVFRIGLPLSERIRVKGLWRSYFPKFR